MDLSSLIEIQISADRRRGFNVDFDTEIECLSQLEKDVVGIVGEIGEFANLLKKIRLAATRPEYNGPSLREVNLELREELADAFIYLIRLSVILGGNLEADLVQKMQLNETRYRTLERPEA